jgi:hypothetical protein
VLRATPFSRCGVAEWVAQGVGATLVVAHVLSEMENRATTRVAPTVVITPQQLMKKLENGSIIKK